MNNSLFLTVLEEITFDRYFNPDMVQLQYKMGVETNMDNDTKTVSFDQTDISMNDEEEDIPNEYRYEFIEFLGKGSYGEVYKAFDKQLKDIVVIKKLTYKASRLLSSRNEIEILNTIQNECERFICLLNSFFDLYGRLNIVMNYIEGNDLSNLSREHLQYVMSQNLEQLYDDVLLLHSMGICHGDLKFNNVMVEKNTNKLHIIDYGGACKDQMCKISFTPLFTHPAVVYLIKEGVPIPKHICFIHDMYSIGMMYAFTFLNDNDVETVKRTLYTIFKQYSETYDKETYFNDMYTTLYAILNSLDDEYRNIFHYLVISDLEVNI